MGLQGLKAHRDPVLWEVKEQVLYVTDSIVHRVPLTTQAALEGSREVQDRHLMEVKKC